MAIFFFSTKLAWLDLFWARESINCWMSQAAKTAGLAVASSRPSASDASLKSRTGCIMAWVDFFRRTAGSRHGSPPEIKEVEPVVGRAATVLRQQRSIACHGRLYRQRAPAWRHLGKIRQRFKVDVVTVAAAIQPGHEQDRAFQDRRHPERTQRQLGRIAQKIKRAGVVQTQRPVAQHAHNRTLAQQFMHLNHRTDMAERNEILLRFRVD